MSRADIATLAAYTLQIREASTKLNQNESANDFPLQLKEEIFRQIAARPWNRYPDFESLPLRTALAEANGLAVENIHVGNGSNELLAAATATFVGPHTPVIVPRPSFALYEKLVAVAGAYPFPVDVDPRSPLLPVDGIVALARSLERPVIIVGSPNNPTGGVLEARSLDRFLETGATVLFDRAYGDFALDSLPPLHDRLVTFSTFSKAWGLAGLRVGWLATTAATAAEIRKVKLPYSLNIFSEAAAVVALRNKRLRNDNVRRVIAERKRIFGSLQRVEGIDVFPSSANFILFRTTRDAREVFEDLCALGVLVRDVSSYPHLHNCLRVSIGTRAENDAFLNALEEVL